MIDVTLLGTSALMPLPDRALSAAYLSCAGRGILFDCGEGTQAAARRAGVSLMKTDIIAISHFHGDHYFGLPGLLQSMNALDREEALYILGPECIGQELEPILKLAGYLKYELRILPMEGGELMLRDICPGFPHGSKLSAFKTKHRVESIGYAFTLPRAGKFMPEKAEALGLPREFWGKLQRGEAVEHEGSCVEPGMVLGEARRGIKIVYSGDTAVCPELLQAAADADLLISEATYGLDEQAELAAEYGHMCFAQAAKIAAEAGARRLWLTHYSPMIKEPEEYVENAVAVFPETECGYDGKSIKLSFEE